MSGVRDKKTALSDSCLWIRRFVQLWISGFGRRQDLWLSDSTYPLLSKYFYPLFCRIITRSRAPKTNKKGRPEPEAAL